MIPLGLMIVLFAWFIYTKFSWKDQEKADEYLLQIIDPEEGYGTLSLSESNQIHILYKVNGYVCLPLLIDGLEPIEGFGEKPLKKALRVLRKHKLLSREEDNTLQGLMLPFENRFKAYKLSHPGWIPNPDEEIL